MDNKYKGFTSVEQGKKLSKILPLTSIDFIWCIFSNGTKRLLRMDDWEVFEYAKHINVEIIPCWSLSALLEVLPKSINSETLSIKPSASLWYVGYRNTYNVKANNAIDDCYQLIVYLHELKIL